MSSFLPKTISLLFLVSIIALGSFGANESRQTLGSTDANAKVTIKNDPALFISTPFDANLAIHETSFPDQTCNITDYGAISDGQVKNTLNFAKAIDDCAKMGGGKVVVPAGVWLTGPIELKDNINLFLDKNAEVRFSTDFSDYLPPVFGRFEGIEYYNFSPMIYANHAKNIAVTGEGILNGQGEAWWNFSWNSGIRHLYSMGENDAPLSERVFATVSEGLRPSFVTFINCDRVLMDGITVLKGPMWTVHPVYSQNVILKNLNINTAPGPSTDGIIIDSSENVLVENITLATGDDAITIKSGRDEDGRKINVPSKNIVLRNITINDAHGAVAIGSEISGDVKNVLAQNFVIKKAQYGFRVKSNEQRGGAAENIWLEDFKIDYLENAVAQFNAYYERRSTGYTDYPPSFKNIHLKNIISSNSSDSINIFGLKENPGAISNLTFKNITMQKARSGMEISNTKNIIFDNVTLAPKYGPIFNLENCQDIRVTGQSCKNASLTCVHASGKDTSNLLFDRSIFSSKDERPMIDGEADGNQVKIQIQ